MKLFTAVCNDARLLAPFLEHYSKIGVDEFYIASAPEYIAALKQFASRYRLTVSLHLDIAESVFGGTQAVSSMRELHQAESEWVVIVDLDEFIEPVQDIAGHIAVADTEGANVVRGIMHDRFAADGRLADFPPGADLSKVYPVKSRFIRDVMQGCDFKGVLVKGQLKSLPGSGHHAFLEECVCSRTVELAHYKWNSTAIARLKLAYDALVRMEVPWAIEYGRAIQHYEANGRFVWEEFDGELT